ncbi:MAG: hypothetical protein Q8N69_00565 [bacterium]|nr:hypothetical protein [bacterium]
MKMAIGEFKSNIVLDFGRIDFITAPNIAKLICLKNVLGRKGRRLILCGVSPTAKGFFMVMGLDGFFANTTSRFEYVF